MDDLISRQAAIDALGERPMPWTDDDYYVLGGQNQYDSDRLAIETVPSAQRWIPCSERLPDAGEYYFVTVQHFGWNCTEYRDIDIAKYEVDGWRSCHNVLAWMPLPAPYRPEGDDKHEG